MMIEKEMLEKPRQRSRESIYAAMTRLGNIYELDFHISPNAVDPLLEKFSNNWRQYNPYKPQNPRFGLSVTSLDGGLSGIPDLCSLKEYFRTEGKLYKESDFRVLTPVAEACPPIHPLLNHFRGLLGRTHFLRLDAGGYFPPHRDGAFAEEPETFRIFVPLLGTYRSNFVFIYGDERITFEEGGVYFINTLVSHSLFSLTRSATMLVCNVLVNEESYALLKNCLQQK